MCNARAFEKASAGRAAGAGLLVDQDEVGVERALVGLGIELGDQRAVAGGADAHVHVRRAARIAAGKVGLVVVAALGVRLLRRAMLVVVVAPGVGRPPLDLRAGQRRAAGGREPPACDAEPGAGAGALGSIRRVEGAERVGPRRRAPLRLGAGSRRQAGSRHQRRQRRADARGEEPGFHGWYSTAGKALFLSREDPPHIYGGARGGGGQPPRPLSPALAGGGGGFCAGAAPPPARIPCPGYAPPCPP